VSAPADRSKEPDGGPNPTGLYAGALVTEIAVILLLWLFGRYFGA
jgi:hypothetical protein